MSNIKTKLPLTRSAGILLHPTSLWTPYGVGDFGPSAYTFIQYLKKAGQKYWQILPLGPTGYLDSPYQCISAFAGNPLLISPDELVNNELLTKKEAIECLEDENHRIKWTLSEQVDYSKVRIAKYRMFEIAYNNLFCKEDSDVMEKSANLKKHQTEFDEFCIIQQDWIDNFVTYFSLKNAHELKSWVEWPAKYRDHDEKAIEKWSTEHEDELRYFKFIQWIFQKQWNNLVAYAHKNDVNIIGDMPIFVAHDSADVWANRELFLLNDNGSLQYQAGVPPDYFSKTGQLWGNPLYNWDLIKKQHFSWWIRRFKRNQELADWIRVDHFRGFEAYWRVEGDASNAVKGEWVKGPGISLFNAVYKKLGNLQILAENLGIITPEVEQLRLKYGFPGMYVLQFAFTGEKTNPHLPYNYEPLNFAYTGTHDNNTTLGWWEQEATDGEKQYFSTYLSHGVSDITEELIKMLYKSVALVAIVPLQDLLRQSAKYRMNTPSVPEGNWKYRTPSLGLDEEKAKWLNFLANVYGRVE
ncbi:MAG: 4-alpha-glucanotransferase [Candidatus Lokiarchaeota archaeon]|nr:4-alpha-glucanotransferase [Candidatus Lokiarchaeota archaeon]